MLIVHTLSKGLKVGDRQFPIKIQKIRFGKKKEKLISELLDKTPLEKMMAVISLDGKCAGLNEKEIRFEFELVYRRYLSPKHQMASKLGAEIIHDGT